MAVIQGLPAFKGLAAAQNGIRIRPGYYTAAPSTELVKGDLIIGLSGSVPRIGVCYSTAAQGVKYIRTRSKSFGSATV